MMNETLLSQVWYMLPAVPVACALLISFLVRPAIRFGMVDHPGGRKGHEVSTPLVGGVAVFVAYVAFCIIGAGMPGDSMSLMAAMIVAVGIGVIDDVREVGHRPKFLAQIIAALIVVSGTSVHVTHFGDLLGFGNLPLGKWSYLVTALSIIGVMNAINMIDGLDGLAGSVVLMPILVLAAIAVSVGDQRLFFELAVLAGAMIGFLYFNLRTPWRGRARVFMGDTGGLLLGVLLTWYSVKLAGAESSPINPITAVWILAVPLLDMGSVMIVRMLQRQSPFHADRQHMHYILVDAGYSIPQVVGIMAMLSLACGLLALQAERAGVPEFVMFFVFLGSWASYLMALLHPQKVVRVASRILPPRHSAAG